MQFIDKTNEPPINWNNWFSKADNTRTYDYNAHYGELHNLRQAKEHLLAEQNWLCGYCQKLLTLENSSIEHIIPQSQNNTLSTNYYNLVVVCKNPVKDINGQLHCDKERTDQLLTNIILYKNARVTSENNHPYFAAYSDGSIQPKQTLAPNILKQVEAFINILNIGNHTTLQANRRDVLDSILRPMQNMANPDKRRYLQIQFNRIYNNPTIEYRQYLLIYLANKIGIN